MKQLFFIFVMLLSTAAHSQTNQQEIKTEVSEVTVFLQGAQIFRQKAVQIPAGESVVKFVNLSPFIDKESIQIKANNQVTVLSINQQNNYLVKKENEAGFQQIKDSIQQVNDKINQKRAMLDVVSEQITLLNANKDFGGEEQITVSDLQQFNAYYREELKKLKYESLQINQEIATLNEERDDLVSELKNFSETNNFPTGEIHIKLKAKQATTIPFEIRYLVENAGWFPSYDIKSENLNQPLELVYKANVKQDTKVDWKNVKLAFSSSDPNTSGVLPELVPYYLNYHLRPPTYLMQNNEVKGVITDNYGEPLIGATIRVDGTTIGAITDIDGGFSITVPNQSSQLMFSYVGYVTKTLPISSQFMNVQLDADNVGLEAVVVVGYGTNRSVKNKKSKEKRPKAAMARNEDKSIPIPMAQVQKPTSVNFEIKTPYTIFSDNKNYVVDIQNIDLPADYQYLAIPKIREDAYLIARISNWEQYNLLDGEANIFIDNTFMGKTLLDLQYASDTLEVSLGQDKRVDIERKRITNFTKRQFIGNKQHETVAWQTTIKNNQPQAISILLIDQIPISQREEIEVTVEELSKGKHNEENGEVRWELTIPANATKEIDLTYKVKYPKFKQLPIE